MMRILFILFLFSLLACESSAPQKQEVKEPKLFSLIPSANSGVDFTNQLDYDKDFNIYTYRNFYNGGGVAIGDVNNDGLMDVYFTANMKSNKLYLNKGNFQFEDITEAAGVGGTRAWSTGVTMADVNGDGWLDIYVANSGDIAGDNKQNELFINQGFKTTSNNRPSSTVNRVPSFSEEAESYGIADQGYGTHASFFDYDKDGDLDLYLLNNSYRSIFDFNLKTDQRPIRDEKGGDKFFKNENDHFIDISEEAGIFGSEIGFGLGVTVGDVNRDGWLDIFVSNDFFERDYLYINQKDGTFQEDLENQILSLSVASMGADMADINNDGLPEIFVTEMLPEGDARFKTKMTFEDWDRYQLNVKNGYYHQFTRNVMQLNNGNGSFSEVGRMAGIEATDWSWGALMADYDNDGQKDLFISNGLSKDIIDQDYINFVSNEEVVRQMISKEGVNYKKLIDTIPSTLIPNYLYKNTGDLEFKNVAEAWGLATPSHSNGSAYADFDNDGDLDLVVNNVNSEAFLYRNDTDKFFPERNYLKVQLIGSGKNPFAIGANVSLKANGQTFYIENIPIRGFQSSVDYRPNFGLGIITKIDSLLVEWPTGEKSLLTDIPTNQTLSINQADAKIMAIDPAPEIMAAKPVFTELKDSLYRHKENLFVDFKRDLLLYHMMSTEGPKICKGDVNMDGLEDFYIGGAANSAGALFVQQSDGKFLPSNTQLFEQEKASEDMDCIFFDADNDGDQDLYVARGGNEFLLNSNALIDQLYFNDGKGNFSRSAQFLPTFNMESSSCVKAADYDGDGDQDLFVGIRAVPGYYGVSTNGYILNNDGKGKFKNVSKTIAPELENLGMIKDALWVDIDQDDDQDLVVVGEWMPLSFFENDKGKFRKVDAITNRKFTEGWWNCIEAGDFDKDGDIDLIVGNHGLNSRFSASEDKPITIHVNDFDQNGTPDPVISQYNGDASYPMVLRHDLTMQLPVLKRKYLKYINYSEQRVEDIFTEEQLKGTVIKKAYELRSSLLINQGNGRFEVQDLPKVAQFSPVYAIQIEDFDKDGNLDVLLGGNLYGVKPEVGRYDANYGLMLKGKGDASFEVLKPAQSGFFLKGEVRDMVSLKRKDQSLLLVAKNNDYLQIFEY